MNEIRKPNLCKSTRRIRMSLPRLVYAVSEDNILSGRLPRVVKAPPEVEPGPTSLEVD